MAAAETKANAEALVPKFKLEKVLNQDQAGRRTTLLGNIDSKPALLVLERAPWPEDTDYLSSVPASLTKLKNLGANDIYRWYMARAGGPSPAAEGQKEKEKEKDQGENDFVPDLKVNLIYPCTQTHIKKYSRQGARYVQETSAIYKDYVRPYMQAKREQGRLNWVFNILDGITEQEDVMYRTEAWGDADDANAEKEGFLMLPDLNWDRRTMEGLHLLALVERRDLWSLRDLKRKHVPWLRSMRGKLIDATVQTYPSVERDQLKLYVHYQPTYYHLHVHIVHVMLEAGGTQAVGKAVGLDSIVETLEAMGGDEEQGMESVSIGYTLGEASELWTQVFEPLKKGEKPNVS